uniref:D-2-hydroxyglutarate dehydrogenase, mitochondrial-like n=1 Tax=Styela clava TaxID=7725 RepID=UPI0019399AA9|nr:D-2-hydroxyglutarate dehydrogenase, mitochondrial-like [Styela clava]
MTLARSALCLINYSRSSRCLANIRQISSSSTNLTLTKLTSELYDVKRGPYGLVSDKDIRIFESILGEQRVITDENVIESYNVDWLNTVRGQSKVLLKPKTTEEVSKILMHCNEQNLAVCPQSGNTGLVGGSVPVFDEIILSMQLMNEITSIDPLTGILQCQSGCILENLNTALASHNLTMPLDLGAKGSCLIGGNLSTNAAGIRFLRYGSLRGSVLGIEAVLADGRVMDFSSTIRKDNTGYDLKQLFIGSEGTLGVITGVSILAPVKPSCVNVAFFGADTFEDLLSLLKLAKTSLGEILSAIEFLDSSCMKEVGEQLGMPNPISEHPFYFLVETSGSNAAHDGDKLDLFVENCLESNFAKDGTLATDLSKIQSIWNLRENIAEALKCKGYTYKYDISLPTIKMYDIVNIMRKRMGDDCTVYGYGHLGDGNLHLNVVSKEYDANILAQIEPFVYDYTASLKGSISAEHGLGFKKKKYIGLNKSPEAISMMKNIKQLLDPKGILNPYTTLPS